MKLHKKAASDGGFLLCRKISIFQRIIRGATMNREYPHPPSKLADEPGFEPAKIKTPMPEH